MFIVSLSWLVPGFAIGWLALGARLRTIRGTRCPWYLLVSGSALGGWLGGWFGLWYWGRLFAPVAALWIAIVAALLIPYLFRIVGSLKGQPRTTA